MYFRLRADFEFSAENIDDAFERLEKFFHERAAGNDDEATASLIERGQITIERIKDGE